MSAQSGFSSNHELFMLNAPPKCPGDFPAQPGLCSADGRKGIFTEHVPQRLP